MPQQGQILRKNGTDADRVACFRGHGDGLWDDDGDDAGLQLTGRLSFRAAQNSRPLSTPHRKRLALLRAQPYGATSAHLATSVVRLSVTAQLNQKCSFRKVVEVRGETKMCVGRRAPLDSTTLAPTTVHGNCQAPGPRSLISDRPSGARRGVGGLVIDDCGLAMPGYFSAPLPLLFPVEESRLFPFFLGRRESPGNRAGRSK